MSAIQQSEFEENILKRVDERRVRVRGSDGQRRPEQSPLTAGTESEGDIVLPIENSFPVESALEYAIGLAELHNARIVLVYVTNKKSAPKGYDEYAKVERITDFTALYLDTLGDETIRPLSAQIRRRGVECTGYTFIGRVTEAVEFYRLRSRVLTVIVPVREGRSFMSRLGFGGSSEETSSLKAPVLLVPTRTGQ